MAEDAGPPRCRRVGILGYGRLGQFLAGQLLARGPPLGLALAFVWARDGGALEGLPPPLRLRDLSLLPQMAVDLVVEVAHPCVAQEHGEDILAHADFMLGSPTALADPLTEQRLRGAAARGGHTLYVPRGALWGCEDIRRMDDSGTLAALKVTMTKAPQSFRLQGWLRERLVAAVAAGGREVLYEGPLRPLCPLAPNNVNTMAAAAVAAPSLGFDGVRACLVADPSIPDWHVVEVEVTSVGDEGRALSVTSTRRNPAAPGAVTGAATRDAFWSSLLGDRKGRDRAPGGTLKAVTPPPSGCASTFRRGACREEGPQGFSGRGAKHAGRKVRGGAGCFRWGPRGTLGVVVPPARCRRCGRRRPGRRRGRFGGHRRAPQTPPPSPPRHRGHVGAPPGRGGRAGAVPRAAAPGALRRPRAQQRPAAPLLHPGGCRRHLQEVGARRPPQPPPQRFGDGQLRRERDHGRAAEPGAGGRLVGQAPVAGAAGAGTNRGLHPQRALPRLTGLRGVAAAPQALAGRPAAGRHLLQPGLQAPRSRPHRRRGRAQGFPPGFPRPRALRGFPRRPPGCGGGRRLAQPRVTRRGDKDDGWHRLPLLRDETAPFWDFPQLFTHPVRTWMGLGDSVGGPGAPFTPCPPSRCFSFLISP